MLAPVARYASEPRSPKTDRPWEDANGRRLAGSRGVAERTLWIARRLQIDDPYMSFVAAILGNPSGESRPDLGAAQ
jgi:hypothetical protein